MENNFSDVMIKHSDGELFEIVTKLRNDYQPEAVLAAEIEIQKRNLSPVQIENAHEEIREKEINLQKIANEPLGVVQRILFFIFFWGIIPWAMASTFKADGYMQKYKDAWRFMKYGFFTFLGFFGLLVLKAYLSL